MSLETVISEILTGAVGSQQASAAKLIEALSLLAAEKADNGSQVRVSSGDAASNYLEDKIVGSHDTIAYFVKSVRDVGGVSQEQLEIVLRVATDNDILTGTDTTASKRIITALRARDFAWKNVSTVFGGTDPATTSMVTPQFEDGWEYRIKVERVSHDAGADRNLMAAVELVAPDDGTVYSAPARISLAPAGVGDVLHGVIDLPYVRDNTKTHQLYGKVFNLDVGLTVDGPNINAREPASRYVAIGYQHLTQVNNVRLTLDGSGQFTSGLVTVERRRTFTQ